LKISEEKTEIRSVFQGFNFLGWNFRRYPNTFLSKISKENISRHRKEIKYLTKTIHSPEILIAKINQKTRGWMNYHHCCNDIWNVWGNLNTYTYERLMKWGRRHHSNKTKKWIFKRYWKHIDGRWTFTVTTKDKTAKLMPYNLRQKRTGRRISRNTNIFDLKNKETIRQVQLAKSTNFSFQKTQVWKKQKGLCPGCKQFLNPKQSDILDLHHVVPRKDGGPNKLSNLILMHEHCHYESHHGKLTS